MVVCTKCKKEMRCVCTGKIAVWFGYHCYAGDEFECPICEATTLVCNKQSYQSKDEIQEGEKVINMTSEDLI